MGQRNAWIMGAWAAIALAATWPGRADAAVPATTQIEGVLLNSAGGPAADGTYQLNLQLLDGPTGAVMWSEAGVAAAVKSGQFQIAAGAKTPLSASVVSGERWLQVQVGTDPPLTAVPVRSVLQALRAGVADGLDCSGCIKATHLDPQLLQGLAKATDLQAYAKSTDLSGYAKVSDLSTYAKTADLADYVKASSLAKVAGTGSYTDLANKPVLAQVGATCGTGLVMKGIKADGSYECVSGAVDAAALPKDGLDEISNGLLTNQFTEVAASSKTPLDIADAFPAGTTDEITVPDYGTVQSVSVALDLTNSDISKLKVTVFDPQGTAYVLHDKSGSGTAIKTTYPSPSSPVSGDFSKLSSTTVKGKWSISVADLAGTSGGKDGKLNSWSVQVKVMSAKKAAVTQGLQLVPAATAPVACIASNMGTLYFDITSKTLRYCDGANWRSLADSCGNGILDINEQCDDGNNANGDGCSATCNAALGLVKANPGKSCLDIVDNWKANSEGTPKDGTFWIAAPKGQVIQVLCDMSSEGGGYTYFGVASGKSTSSSTDDNTCKDYGMDIFYPRSKAQWTWVLGKFDSSFFATIPGVTKPADSGNYTGCIMRHPASYGGNSCGDWKVPDGGRWWLRDSTYGEPNGDYTANCWLSMYSWNANDIQFNDGGCGYATTKYVCSTNDKK